MCMILFPKVVVSISGSVCSAHTKTHFGEDPFPGGPNPPVPRHPHIQSWLEHRGKIQYHKRVVVRKSPEQRD